MAYFRPKTGSGVELGTFRTADEAKQAAYNHARIFQKVPASNAATSPVATEAQRKLYASAVDRDILLPLREKYGPLLERLSKALDMADEPMKAEIQKMRPELEAMRNDLPNMLQKNPQAAKVLEQFLADAVLDGLREGGKPSSNKKAPTIGNDKDAGGHGSYKRGESDEAVTSTEDATLASRHAEDASFAAADEASGAKGEELAKLHDRAAMLQHRAAAAWKSFSPTSAQVAEHESRALAHENWAKQSRAAIPNETT